MPRILVVDDDPTVGATIEVLLQRQGFDVTLTDGGETGLAALESQAFDVMLVDIFMPHMRGFESIRIFHERAPATPLIAMSGYAFASSASPSPDFLRMALELGATRCLRKPFTPEAPADHDPGMPCRRGRERAAEGPERSPLIPTQRVILGVGLAILLIITAASIALDVKSRSDAASVNHTVQVQKKISDLRVLLRRAESAARGYELYRSQGFSDEFQAVHAKLAPALAELKRDVRDTPDQVALLEGTEPLALRRIEIAATAMRLRAANDQAGIAALNSKAEGRGLMDTVMRNLDRLSAEEERLLAARSQDSRRTGIVLLGIDVAGAVLILLLVALVMRESRRTTGELQSSLEQTQAAKAALEAAVAERTEHLVAAHDELRLSVNVLQSTFRSMAEAVLVIDAEGTVLLSNPAAERMLLHRTGMNVGNLRALSDVFHGDGVTPLPPDELPSTRVLRGEQFEELEMIVRPHSGNPPRHLMVSGRPMRDGQGNISGAVLVYHDATTSRETERQLHQSQKLDAIGKLTGGVAHDFNNMLTVISGNTETLVERLKDQPELQRTARLIDDAAERCAELIQHLLAFARRQPLEPRNVDINAAISDIAKLLRPTLGEQIQIETVLEQGPMTTHIDPSRLTNAVLNMAINARDAMPGGGKLLLETHRVVLDEAYAQANADVAAGPYIMLAVSDTGTGMPSDVQQKAFEPFFTTKEVGKGSGLGLSMVYGFVKQSGGHIKIYSEEGHGTTIKLYLPPGEGAADIATGVTPTAEGGAETIFVVEDDPLVRNFVTAQLQSLGYKTVASPDGKAALDLIEAGQSFDLLFTDVVIPGGMSGRELAEEVARRRPGVKVLYTSGYTDNAIVHHGKLDDGVLLLTKPYRRNQLAEMIRKALNGGGMAPS